MAIKIFCMSEGEWWAAATAEAAVADMCNEYGWTVEEAKEEGFIDFPVEALTEAEMDALVFFSDDDGPMTFRAQLDKQIASGRSFPAIFATESY